MARVKGDKYNKKYARLLKKGARKEGISIMELCQEWGICRGSYNYWVENHPEFTEAHEYGIRDAAAWWYKTSRKAACGQIKANAGIICFALKNIEGIEWKDKVEVDSKQDNEIRTININILPPRQLSVEADLKVIEHDDQA